MLRITFLLATLNLCVSLPSKAQDCETETDEFTGVTTTMCDVGRVQIEEQPTNRISYTDLFLLSLSDEEVITLGLSTRSDSWNFLDKDRAYALIDGDRYTFEILEHDGSVDNGSVIEQTGIDMTPESISAAAEAETFRVKIGTAVFDFSAATDAIEHVLSD